MPGSQPLARLTLAQLRAQSSAWHSWTPSTVPQSTVTLPQWGEVVKGRKGSWRGMCSSAASKGPVQGGATSDTKFLSYLLLPLLTFKRPPQHRHLPWKHSSTTTVPKSETTRVFIPPQQFPTFSALWLPYFPPLTPKSYKSLFPQNSALMSKLLATSLSLVS